MKNIEEKTRELFAKNYPLAGNDGIFGPFTVGNVTLMSTLKGEALPAEKQRIIYNICAVSDRSKGGLTYSHPALWGQSFQSGELVHLIMSGGYLQKLARVRIQPPLKRSGPEAQLDSEKQLDVMGSEDADAPATPGRISAPVEKI